MRGRKKTGLILESIRYKRRDLKIKSLEHPLTEYVVMEMYVDMNIIV